MQIKLAAVILVLCLSALASIESALLQLPENLKVDSHVEFLNENEFSRFKVTEYVNIQDGSIRLDIIDENQKNGTKTSYFRLMSNNDREDRLIDRTVITHDLITGKCKAVNIQEWPLKDLTRLLIELSTPKNKLMGINEGLPNRTFLGPSSLLRLMHSNSGALKLFSKSKDELGDRDEYHFSLLLNDWDKSAQLVARLLVTLSVDNLNNEADKFNYNIGETTLSLVSGDSHLSRITVAVLDRKSGKKSASLNKHASPEFSNELYITNSGLVEQLTVSYKLIQEHSLSRHTGLEHLSDEVDDPFMMPVGIGCGLLSSNKHFYVKATQFSGQFEASGYEGQYFVAYDETSNHLRYDIVGKSKMIYALDKHSVTYIADDSTEVDDAALEGVQLLGPANSSDSGTRSGEPRNYYDRSHCAQALLKGEPGPSLKGPSLLYDKKKIDSILGVGEAVQLMYLGQKRLTRRYRNAKSSSFEPITCQVFERLVPYDQLPALILMHLSLKPRENNELLLVYYFIDEIGTQTKASLFNEQLNAYESMWLKRIELYSRNLVSKYIFNNAQLTFSQSSWSLETVGEDTRNRETQLGYPVRSFDTLECWPERNAVELDAVLTQRNPDEWKEKGLVVNGRHLSVKQMESFEETIMTFLSSKLNVDRSQVNEFKLEPKAPDNFESIMVKSKLTSPFSYIYRERIIGWVESHRSLIFNKQAVMVSRKDLVLLHECSLDLATRMSGPYKFTMLYCPNFGCGFLLGDPSQLKDGGNKTNQFHPFDSQKDNQFNLSIYNEMCTIHSVSKTVQREGMLSPERHAELALGTLSGAAVSIKSYQLDPQTKSFKATQYRAQVSKISVISSKSLQSYGHDERIVQGLCFTPETQPLRGQQQIELGYGNGSLIIRQLAMDPHHSQAHCRKACVLLTQCETYSYNHAERLCVLTNILPSLLRDPEITFKNLITRKDDCAIYALDQLIHFKQTREFIRRHPADFVQSHGEGSKTSVILWADLVDCARYAHSSSWAMPKHPDQRPKKSFGYMALKQMCLLYDIDREEFLRQFSSATERLIRNLADLQKFIGSQEGLSEPEDYETYHTDPRQFHKSKSGHYIDITGDTLSTQARTKLEDQGVKQCLEACTESENCVTVDHCSYSVDDKTTQECFLYDIRSPYAIDSFEKLYNDLRFAKTTPYLKLNSSNEKFTALEEDLYVQGRSKSRVIININYNCDHFYLTGDNLYIKQLLARDQKVLDPYDTTQGPREIPEIHSESIDFSWMMWLRLFGGLTLGCGIFIVQPAITKLITRRQVSQTVRELSNKQIDDIRRALRAGSWRRQADHRSQQLEFNEMVRMG